MDELPGLKHDQYQFLVFVLNNVFTGEQKFKRLSKSAPVVEEVQEYLHAIGFRDNGRQWVFEGAQAKLEKDRNWLQKRADESLDPETISFAKVAEILQRKGTLPGINQDIDDYPVDGFVMDEVDRPKKPWET